MKPNYEPSSGRDPRADKILKCYQISRDAFESARSDSEEAVRYVNNDSWSTADKTAAEKHNKPTLKYNLMIPILNALRGNEELARNRALIKPTNMESVDIADIMQGRFNAIVDEQDLEEKIQVAMCDALIMRMGGALSRKFRMNAEGYLDFYYELENSMRLYYDPELLTSDYRLEKCRWVIRETWMTLDEIMDKFYVSEADLDHVQKVEWWNELSLTFKRFTNSDYSLENDDYDKQNNTYKVLEMQERRSALRYNVYDNGQYYMVEPKQYREFKKMSPKMQMVRENYEDTVQVTTMIPFFHDLIVYDEKYQGNTPRMDLMPLWSYELNIQADEMTALMELIKDIQDDINKGKSQVRDYISQLLAGGLVVKGRGKNTERLVRQLKRTGNQPNQVYQGDPNVEIEPIRPGVVPPDIMINTQDSRGFAHEVSSVDQAMLGQEGKSGESNALRESKISRAAAVLNPYFRNVAKMRKVIVEDFCDNFSFVYAELNRLITGKDEKGVFYQTLVNLQWAGEVLNDVKNASIIVELDQGENNITSMEENFNKMLALVNTVLSIDPAMAKPMVIPMLETSPVKGADKMIEGILGAQDSGSQLAEAQAQLEKTREMLEQQEIRFGMKLDTQKLELDRMKIMLQHQEKMLDIAVKRQSAMRQPAPQNKQNQRGQANATN